MQKRLIVYIILLNILLSVFIPNISKAEEAPWWNENWSFRQEINVPIDTSDNYAKYQPIDIPINFNNTCWAKNEDEHSIRVIYQLEDSFLELDSQIYDLDFDNIEVLKSCNLVFLIPEQANGEEKYFVYYDKESKSGPNYKKRIDIDESYYKYEPIQGLGFESSYFKITQGEEIIYAVNKEGTVLGEKVSQQVTRLKKGAKDILPHNGDQIASFGFTYWWYKEEQDWCGISSSERFISKQLFVNGNLMVKFGIVSESKDGLLRSTVIYKYYFCPTEEKRIYTHVKHEVINYPLPRGEEIDVAYIILSCGGLKSSTIDELNFGEIPPHLHFYSDEERIKSHNFDQYPDYSDWQAIIHKTDDYDLGSIPWLSVDYGESGKAHGVIFNSTNILKSGNDERDGIEIQLFEAKSIQYPGLDGRIAELYIMRNAFEPNEPNDEIIPEDYIVEFDAEYFTTENGGYPGVEKEAGYYQKLISYHPEVKDVVDKEEDVEKYILTVYPHLPRSLLLKYRISTLLLKSPQITAEIIRNGESIAYCKTHRVPITEDIKIDWKNISFFRKIIFTNIPSGKYVVKIWLENTIFSDEKEFIGYQIIDLKKDEKIRIFCKHQGKLSISVDNQDQNGIENVKLKLLDDDLVISESVTDSNGKAIIKAPCGIGSKYTLNTTYKGFFIDKQNIRLGRIRQYLPQRVHLSFDTHDLEINILDSEDKIPDFDVDFSVTSDEMQLPITITPNSTTDGNYKFKALYPADYILKIKYGQFEVNEKIKIPDISTFNIKLYDLKVLIKDDWNLSPEAPIDVYLTSRDFEKTVVLNAKKLSSDEYLFSDIYSGNYTIKISYKTYNREENIRLPHGENGEIQIVFSALFNITTKVLNVRGEPLKDARVIFSRGEKEIEGISDNKGNILFNIPPGIYNSSIYLNEELIAQRKVDVSFDKDYSVVTKSEPTIPFVILVFAIFILAFALLFSYKKKNILLLLKLLVIVLAMISIVSPWWTIEGYSSEHQIKTSTNLFLIPAEMTTLTENTNITAGEVTILDEQYNFIIDLLPLGIISGILFLLVSIFLKRYIRGKLTFFILILVLIIFVGTIGIFTYATSEMANATVGSLYGSNNLDINIPGEDIYEVISCNWGPGISFYLFLFSIIIILIIFVLKIIKKDYFNI